MYSKIFKNTSWLIIAQVITKVVSFFYVIFLARDLGVENFGLYTVAVSYFSLVSSIADFGISRYLVREVARDHKTLPELLSSVIFLRMTLMSVVFAIFAILMYQFDPVKIRVSLSLIAVIAVLPQVVAFSFDSVFVALQKLSFSAVSLLVFNVLSALAGFILVKNGFGAFGAVVAIILGQFIYVLCLVIFLIKQKIPLLTHLKENLFGEILTGSLPYGLLGILGLLYFKIDTLLLSYIKGSYDTGIYGAGYKFLEAIIFVPTTFAVVVFPVFAQLHNVDKTKLKKLYFNSLKIMGVLGFAVFLGYLMILPAVIRIFLPSYLPSVEVLKILSFSIPFMFMHVPSTQLLFSTDKYLKLTIFLSLLTLGLNISLNILLIPIYGYMGASYVTVFSEITSFLIFFNLLQRKVFKE